MAFFDAVPAGRPGMALFLNAGDPPLDKFEELVMLLDEAAEHGSAYIYLVAAYGRSGTVGPPDLNTLVPVMAALRETAKVPIAVGFGVKTRAHIDGLGEVGADAAIVGSACVKCVTDSLANGTDVIEDFRALLLELGAEQLSSNPSK